MLNALKLENISVAIEGRQIIDSVSLSLKQGDIGCLLGPSGCGKTTLLRTIAGFEQPAKGELWISNRRVSNAKLSVPVEGRNVGMVLQDFALFPHLNVKENIEFGLRKLSKRELDLRVEELTELLEISTFLMDYPHRLSGGQQQRVAIARAIAPRPKILLLDEPFASLDVELREQIATEIRTVLKQDRITAMLVSHNQLEAFAMADEIGVIRSGCLLQWDSAFNLYHRPVCTYVADFVGEGVFLPGQVSGAMQVQTELGAINGRQPHGFKAGEKVSVLIRPDDIIHDDASDMQAIVLDKAFRGAQFLYTLRLFSGATVLSLVPSNHDHAVNEAIGIRLEIDHLVVFQKE